MNNLLSYCGLVDARIRASEKDLPVPVRSEMGGRTLLLCKNRTQSNFIALFSRSCRL